MNSTDPRRIDCSRCEKKATSEKTRKMAQKIAGRLRRFLRIKASKNANLLKVALSKQTLIVRVFGMAKGSFLGVGYEFYCSGGEKLLQGQNNYD